MGLGKAFKKLALGHSDTGQIPLKLGQDGGLSQRQIYQNRRNYGPNLGSMFVLEKWISGHMFDDKDCDGGSELDAVRASIKHKGVDSTRERWEENWRTWVSEDDWKYLADNSRATAVRLPIGYWNVANGKYTSGTDFDKVKEVYIHSWDAIIAVIDQAAEHGLAVLVDLHALPGGANGQEHSGTSSGVSKFWSSSRWRDLGLDIVEELASALKSKDNVCGLELANEVPELTSEVRRFYVDALKRIRKVNEDIPVVISDGWSVYDAVKFAAEHPTAGFVVDSHVYKCFSDSDRSKSPDQLISDVDGSLPPLNDADVLVGEFSCVLDGQTWSRLPSGQSRDAKAIEYGQRQAQTFVQKASTGSYFWTYKFKWGSGGEWGFREMSDKGALAPLQKRSSSKEQNDLGPRLNSKFSEHKNYWNNVDKGKDWEHYRYELGFRQGWSDAEEFAAFNGSELGRKVTWRTGREQKHIAEHGKGKKEDMVWVWRHGYDQGVAAYL